MLNQRLQQKLLQKLSPQQILLMKLLQIPSVALEQRIKQEVEENPALEMLDGTEEAPQEDNQVQDEDNSQENEQNDSEEEFENNDVDDEFDLSDYLSDDEMPDYRRIHLSVNPDPIWLE